VQSSGQIKIRSPNFLDRFRNFVERTGQRLNVFALQGSNERFGKFLSQLLGDSFIFAPAFRKRRQIACRLAFLQFREQIDQVMNAAIGLLRRSPPEGRKTFRRDREIY